MTGELLSNDRHNCSIYINHINKAEVTEKTIPGRLSEKTAIDSHDTANNFDWILKLCILLVLNESIQALVSMPKRIRDVRQDLED